MRSLSQGNTHLIGFYRLDNITGLNDSSSCRNSPGIENDTTLGLGYIGEPDTAYRFRGAPSSYVRLPNNGTFSSQSVTLLTWFNAATLTGQQTIWQFSSEGRLAILLALHVDKLQLDVYPNCDENSLSFSPAVTLETFTWYFIGISYYRSTGKIHFWIRGTDGSQHHKWFFAGFIELETYHDIWLGYGPESPGAFNGSIACVQIYNVWLSEDGITNAQKMCLPREWSGRYATMKFSIKSKTILCFFS